MPVPVVTSATTAGANIGVAFSYQITGTNTPTSYGASGLPTGLSLNATTGLITGSPSDPTQVGAVAVTLSATNGAGASANVTLTITLGIQVIVGRFTTLQAATDGSTVFSTRQYHCLIRNLGAYKVGVSESAAPNADPTAGLQSTLNAAPPTGQPDEVMVGPGRKVYLTAKTAAVLVSVEEIQHPFMQSNA